MTAERSLTGPGSVPMLGLLVTHLIQISIMVLWHLELEIVRLAPQLMIQMLSQSFDPFKFILLRACQACDFGFYHNRCACISYLYLFSFECIKVLIPINDFMLW